MCLGVSLTGQQVSFQQQKLPHSCSALGLWSCSGGTCAGAAGSEGPQAPSVSAAAFTCSRNLRPQDRKRVQKTKLSHRCQTPLPYVHYSVYRVPNALQSIIHVAAGKSSAASVSSELGQVATPGDPGPPDGAASPLGAVCEYQ